MYDPIIAEVHEARWKLFEEAGCDLHVFFQRLREAEKQHEERLRNPPRRSPNNAEPGGLPYAGSAGQRFRRVPAPNPSRPNE